MEADEKSTKSVNELAILTLSRHVRDIKFKCLIFNSKYMAILIYVMYVYYYEFKSGILISPNNSKIIG